MTGPEGLAVNHPAFERVVATAMPLLDASGGGALCVYLDGQPVLDMWTGYRDPGNQHPWERDTMAMSWSTTKGLTSTALHMLVDRGQLSYDDPVAEYWPEFAVKGKDRTTIRHLMSMEAGLFDIRHLIHDARLMLDHDALASALAAATPRHEPGARNAYHAMTYGWLVAELVKRLTGRSLGAFVQSEIVKPLDLDGCFIGTPDDQLWRVAALPHLAPQSAGVLKTGRALNPVTSLFGVSLERIASAFIPADANDVIRSVEFLQAEVPSVNGVFTARCPFPKRKTVPTSFGFYGAYGSGAFADTERGLAVGLVCRQAKALPLVKLVGPILDAAE